MQQLSIPMNSYHSYVDLITNSSSVVYVMARPNAVDQIHEMVDNILAAGNSEVRSRDLFNISIHTDVGADYVLDQLVDDGHEWVEGIGYYDVVKLLDGEGDPERVAAAEQAKQNYIENSYDSYYDSYIRVNVNPDIENESATLAAKVLSSLQGFFHYEASYDG